jgi:acyl phosphate:glycerol-3-phosphate acyltransferase
MEWSAASDPADSSRRAYGRLSGSPERGSRGSDLNAPHLLNFLLMLLSSVAIAVAAYLLGSVPVGYLLVRIFRHEDIRSVGSGNIGATNVLRSGGKGLGAATFVLDVLKGASAVWIAALVATAWLPTMQERNVEALAALCAVIGHMFPIWLRFKGGKGVATGFGVFLAATPLAALAAITLFAIVLALSRYVSLASILAAATFPILAWSIDHSPRPAFFIAVQAIISFLIIVKHHPNVRRLLAGTENRFGAAKTA